MRDITYFENKCDELYKDNEELRSIIKILMKTLLKVSPVHRDWLDKNFGRFLEEAEDD